MMRKGVSPALTLSESMHPDRNNLTLVRLALAGAVLVSHSWPLGGWGDAPRLGGSEIGGVAVDAFFAVSGYLVTASVLRDRSPWRYVRRRALRLMPAFWVCLIVTGFVLAPLAALLAPGSLSPTDAARYVLMNADLTMREDGIGTVLANVAYRDDFNGSLWTLRYEAMCYVAVLIASVLGLLSRARRLLLPILTAALWLFNVAQVARPDTFEPVAAALHLQELDRLLLMFLIGACLSLWASHVRLNPVTAGAAAILLSVSFTLPDYRLLGAAPLGYLCLWAASATRRWGGRPLAIDYSYGLYLYAFPVQQLCAVAGVPTLGFVPYTLCSSAIALTFAAASWRWVEEPALRLKPPAHPRVPVQRPAPNVASRSAEVSS